MCMLRKHKKHSKKPSSDVIPLVSYQSAEDDEEGQTSAPVFGPFLPSHDSAAKHTDQSAAETATSHVSEQSTAIASRDSPKTESEKKPDENVEIKTTGDGFDDEIQKLKALHEKFQKRTQRMKHSEPKDSDTKETASGRESANFPPKSASSEVLVSSKLAQTAENFPDVACLASEVEVATEENLQLTDGETFVRYEYTNRRYGGDDVAPPTLPLEEMELDVEDIDKQLEMALARHKVSEILSVLIYYQVFAILELR